jgi:beta-galactosidase
LTRSDVTVERDGPAVVVRAVVVTGAGIRVPHEQRILPLADGSIRIDEQVAIPPEFDDLARVGTVLETVPDLESLEWFGIGPAETYPDRKRGGTVGRWRSSVTDQLVPYVRPQENGGHADVRWLELRDGLGAGLRITLDEPRQVSVTHVRAADLAAARHDVEVTPIEESVIHLDAAHRGLGTASCGPDTLPRYRLGHGTYRWSWTLSPVGPSS